MAAKDNFYAVLNDVLREIEEHGYDDPQRIQRCRERLDQAARGYFTSIDLLTRTLRDSYALMFFKLIERGGILQQHRGVDAFTLTMLKPKLKAELDKRIIASANLIKLNREQAIAKTLQRFEGWATSVPAGGLRKNAAQPPRKDIKKALASMPFIERRVNIDQAHKFAASLNDIIASDGGAIAAIWHSNWRETNYHYRKEHKDRDGHVYAIRGNWALKAKLMKVGPDGYSDQFDQPAEKIWCRCFWEFVYSLSDLPNTMLMQKGRDTLADVHARMAMMET